MMLQVVCSGAGSDGDPSYKMALALPNDSVSGSFCRTIFFWSLVDASLVTALTVLFSLLCQDLPT